MERHARLQHGLVLRAQRDRPLAPVRRIAQPDRIAAARAALDPRPFQRFGQRVGDVTGAVARPRRLQPGLQPLDQRRLGPQQEIRRRAQEDRARKRRVIPPAAARHLEKGGMAGLERPPVPGQVRRRGIRPRRQQRHDRRVIAPGPVDAANRVAEDLGHDLVLGLAGLDPLQQPVDDLLRDRRRLAHEGDLGGRLDRALPVHQPGRIHPEHLRQRGRQGLKGLGREIVIVHLDADPALFQPQPGQPRRQILHRVPLGRLHVIVRVAPDAFFLHPDRAQRAVGILVAAPPDRILVRQDDHPLVHVKRPAVISGQPRLIRRIGDKQRVQAPFGHLAAGQIQAAPVLGKGKWQIDRTHFAPHQNVKKLAHMDTRRRAYKYFFHPSQSARNAIRAAEILRNPSCCGVVSGGYYRGRFCPSMSFLDQVICRKRVAQRALTGFIS